MFNQAAAIAKKSTSPESTSNTPLRRSSRKHHAPDSYAEVKPRGKMRSASVQETSSRQGKIAIESVNKTLRQLRADCLRDGTPSPDRAVRCVAPPPSPVSVYSDHEFDYLNVDELDETTDDDMEVLENAVRGVSPSTSSVFEHDSIKFSENPSSSETSASPSPCPSPSPQKSTRLGPVRILTDEEKKQVDEALLRQYPPEHYQKICSEHVDKFFPGEKEAASLKAEKYLDSIRFKATEAMSTKQTHPAGFVDPRFPGEKPMPWKYLEKYANETPAIKKEEVEPTSEPFFEGYKRPTKEELKERVQRFREFFANEENPSEKPIINEKERIEKKAQELERPVEKLVPKKQRIEPTSEELQNDQFLTKWLSPDQCGLYLVKFSDTGKPSYVEIKEENAEKKATD